MHRFGAAFTCANLGLSTEPREDHAQYIQSWLKVLKADKRAIFTAASKAQQATDWLVQRAGRVAEVAWDAEYCLEAYFDSQRNRKCPGFVIEHSCGLSLVHPCESGELGVTEHGADEDIRQNSFVTHTQSGRGFGLTLNFKRATDALLLAASFKVDWTQDAEALKSNPEFRHAGHSVLAAYGSGHQKDTAKRHLADLERAA